MNYKETTVVVTGGAGFIGSYLCETLLNEGFYVVCIDNFFTGKMRNIEHLKNNSRFEVIRHDIVDSIKVEADQIYNMACPASPIHYQYNPIKTIKTSVMGTMNVLGLAKRTGARVFQASTSEVYGDPEIHPQHEDYRGSVNIIGPRSCYDEGKRVAETLCYDYHRAHNVDIRVARIFNTYGPRMDIDDGRVVSNFIVQAIKGEDITIYGDGSQTRSFCFVTDLVRGIIDLMNHPDCTSPMNLGNDGEFSILELAEKVIEITGSKSKIIKMPLPADDPTRRRPDLTFARKTIGFNPQINLEEGLRKTIPYYRTILGLN